MRTTIATASAVGVAAVVVASGVALAQPRQAAQPVTSTATTLRVVAHRASDQTIDLGRKGFSAGDEDLSVARLTSGGRRVGTFSTICTTVAVGSKATQLCTQSFQLAHGDIEASGAVTSTQAGPSPFDWAITGGTGDYRAARGSVHVIPGNRTVHMTLHVTR